MLSFHNHRKLGLSQSMGWGLCLRNLNGHEVLLHVLALTHRLPLTYAPKNTAHFQMQNGKEFFLSGGGGTTKIKKTSMLTQHECDSCLLMRTFTLNVLLIKINKTKFFFTISGHYWGKCCSVEFNTKIIYKSKILKAKCNSFYHSFCFCFIREMIYKGCYLPRDAIFPRV